MLGVLEKLELCPGMSLKTPWSFSPRKSIIMCIACGEKCQCKLSEVISQRNMAKSSPKKTLKKCKMTACYKIIAVGWHHCNARLLYPRIWLIAKQRRLLPIRWKTESRHNAARDFSLDYSQSTKYI